MITFVLSAVLGVSGIIKPESFDVCCLIILIETMLDLPLFLTGAAVFNKIRDREERTQDEDDQEDCDEKQNGAAAEVYQTENFFERCAHETGNPYAQNTCRYTAWEELHEQDRKTG